MAQNARFLDMGRVVGADPTGKTDTVYAHFEGTDYDGPEPFAVAIKGAMFDDVNISREPGTEFWAEISAGASQPSQVNPRLLSETEVMEDL